MGKGLPKVETITDKQSKRCELNEKYPGGVEKQAALLKEEGHIIEPGKGKKPPKVIILKNIWKIINVFRKNHYV